MSINSVAFLLFLAVAVALYYLFPRRFRWWVLLAASAFFYLCYSLRATAYLAVTVLLSYAAARALDRLHRDMQAALQREPRETRAALKKRRTRAKRGVLTAALLVNFLTLAVFKYSAAWLDDLNRFLHLVGVSFRFRTLTLLLPLGISFYIFQVSGYLIDVYRGKARAERNLGKYALFVCYFPQMLQGPISRFGALHPQLIEGNAFDAENLRDGLQLMIFGMLKKVFIADVLAGGVAELYRNYASYSGVLVFLGAALYCVQLYADFSGGTDMIRGVSQMFGIHLMDNFRRPYFAVSIDDFWRRWHISLGEWMKDYLFYPLALSHWLGRVCKKLRGLVGQRVGKLLVPCASTVVVFLVVGVWQGPGFSNIAYGLWNGFLMSGAMLFAPLFERLNKRLHLSEDGRVLRVVRILRTFLLIVIGRYFSRALSFGSALGMLRQTVTRPFWNLHLGALFQFGITPLDWCIALCACGVLFFISLQLERGVDLRARLAQKPAVVQFLPLFFSVLLLIAFVYLNGSYTEMAFIYENV